MKGKSIVLATTLAAMVGLVAPVQAQFTELVTDFETDRAGNSLPYQPASFEDLEVVMLQDPREADVTLGNIVSDTNATTSNGLGYFSSEESFVANFTGDGFLGYNSSTQFLDIRFEWTTPANPQRWALIETLQSPMLGDPSLHLDGVVTLHINFPNCSAYEFGTLPHASEIGVALLIRETGNNLPQGFRDPDSGNMEFVGVDSVANANTASPVPVPSIFQAVTDADCSGGASDWITLTFDLDALQAAGKVVGWQAQGGDGVLDATGMGDLVNRGSLAGLVLAVRQTDTTSAYLEFLVDRIEFDAPATEPSYPPTISTPVVKDDTNVQVINVISRADEVILEIDRSDANNDDPFTVDETVSVDPNLNSATEARYTDIAVTPALAEGDRLRARQRIGGDTSANSLIVKVNPPAAFSVTIAIDEDGNMGVAPADFEFVGAAGISQGAPQGKPVFPMNGVWQNVEFSLVPGAEPVIDFAGGNGALQPDGGSYNIDSLWFSIDPTNPNVGPYSVFIDHLYIVDAADNEVVIGTVESANPFGNFRGQSTAINASSIISGLASWDFARSNRIQWSFPDAASSNTCSVYRPDAVFADTTKAVGMWLLVEDAKTNGLAIPSVAAIYGHAALVEVDTNTTGATQVDLFVNGSPAGFVTTSGVEIVKIAPTVQLNVGDYVTAHYTEAEGISDEAWARRVSLPTTPALVAPIVPSDTSVTVTGLMTLALATASEVRVYADDVLVGTNAAPGGQASVAVTVPSLTNGQVIRASQVVNGVESGLSAAVTVGVPAPIVLGPLDAGETTVTVTGLDTLAETVTVHVNANTYPVSISNVTSYDVPVPALNSGDVVKATQTIAGLTGPFSNLVLVANYVVVNELLYDDSGADTHQFIELYNFGPIPINISGFKIVVGDTAARYTYTIPASTTIGSHDFWCVGQTAVSTMPGAVVDVVDNTLNFGDSGFASANGEMYFALRNPSDVLLDAVAVETNKALSLQPADVPPQLGGGIFGNMVAANEPLLIADARWRDGADTDNNGRDFGLQKATPGYTNHLADLRPYVVDADALVTGADLEDWTCYFAPPRVIDPAVADALNPVVIQASPQGGKAFITRDTPGGNAAFLDQLSQEDFTLETYVYIAPTFLTAGSEEYRFGIRGAGCGVHNYDFYNGSTGLCWYFRRGTTEQFAYLLDENDGGDSGQPIYAWATVLGSVTIGTDPALTGWQRLLIETRGNYVLGIFGGTYGSRADGIQFLATHNSPGPGGVWITHREAGTVALEMRPPTMDNYQLTTPAAGGNGDADADGDVDLGDFAVFQECFGQTGLSSPCTLVDMDGDDTITLGDYLWFEAALVGP